VALAVDAFARPPLGEYQLQAAIAALHDEAERPEDTDWPQSLALYDLLEQLSGNPMVTLNRAVAAAMLKGPAVGLKLLEPLDTQLAGHYRLDAVPGICSRDARGSEGRGRALPRCGPAYDEFAEQHYLTTQAARLSCVGRG
jgi:predicted RNA polymerase sigma factor